MKKNVNLHFEDVREQLRDKCGKYESASELLADVTKAIFWANVEVDPLGDSEDFDLLDAWGLFESACKVERYVGYAREYLGLDTTIEGSITSCYIVFEQKGSFVRVCGCEPVHSYEAMYDGECIIIEAIVRKDGKIIGLCL